MVVGRADRHDRVVVETMGIEPTTPCLQSRCSSHLSYVPVRDGHPIGTRLVPDRLTSSVMDAPERIQQWWEHHHLPRLVDLVLSDRLVGRWRHKIVSGAHGRVLEVGFGGGLNLPHYTDDVDAVVAVDPSTTGWNLAQERIAAFGRPVERVSEDAAVIDLPDQSVDTVISTWSLCSIPDVASALDEIARVLKPGGEFRLVEHSIAPSPRVNTIQRRIQPVWGRFSGGCHVDRDIAGLVANAGFDVSTLTSEYAFRRLPVQPWSWFVSGSTQRA